MSHKRASALVSSVIVGAQGVAVVVGLKRLVVL
jgi:hypothetical protein